MIYLNFAFYPNHQSFQCLSIDTQHDDRLVSMLLSELLAVIPVDDEEGESVSSDSSTSSSTSTSPDNALALEKWDGNSAKTMKAYYASALAFFTCLESTLSNNFQLQLKIKQHIAASRVPGPLIVTAPEPPLPPLKRGATLSPAPLQLSLPNGDSYDGDGDERVAVDSITAAMLTLVRNCFIEAPVIKVRNSSDDV